MGKRNRSIMVLMTAAVLIFVAAGSVLAQTSDPAMGNMNMAASPPAAANNAAAAPKEVPLGSTPADPNGAAQSANLDLQVAGNSNGSGSMMDDDMMTGNMNGSNNMGMMGDDMMMGNMNNSNMQNMNNAQPTANNPVTLQLLAQLQSTNTLIAQLLTTLQNQPGGNSQAQLQPLHQLLANQNALIKTLYASLNNPGNNQTGGNMNNSSGGMSGMGMM